MQPEIEFYAKANLGVFGLVRPENLTEADVSDPNLKRVLSKFSFPSLNIVFSAWSSLRSRRTGEGAIGELEKAELRVVLAPLGNRNEVINDPNACTVLGLFPHSAAGEKEERKIQLTPNISALLTEAAPKSGDQESESLPDKTILPAAATLLPALISALGIEFGPLFRPKVGITEAAFIINDRKFGWYLRSTGDKPQEGLHYGTAFLQVREDVKKLRVEICFASDWKGTNLHEKTENVEVHVYHPKLPIEPTIGDLTSTKMLPLIIPRPEVQQLLGITAGALDKLEQDGFLRGFAAGITQGSLTALIKQPGDRLIAAESDMARK